MITGEKRTIIIYDEFLKVPKLTDEEELKVAEYVKRNRLFTHCIGPIPFKPVEKPAP